MVAIELIVLVVLAAVAGLVFVLLVGRKPTGARAGAGGAPTRVPAAQPRPFARPTVAAVVEQLARVGDEETSFLDRATGRFVTLRDDLLGALQGDDSLETEDHPDASDLDALRAKLRTKVLLQLPTKAETREFQLKDRFCEGLPDGATREQMLKVLRAETGFRSFEGAVDRLGLGNQWRAFRDAEFARIASAWLQRHRLAA
jgi:hypothetical protein